MNPMASRKQLLVAESELNRAQLVEDWRTMAGEVHALGNRVRTIGSLATVATLVAGLACFRPVAAAATNKTSWLQTILKGAGIAGSLWSVFRPKRCEWNES
jgi:hypothetical protein